MFENRHKFIEANRDVLLRYLQRAGEKDRFASGFGFDSPKETLSQILNDGDAAVLPYGLLHIYFDHENPSDRDFVLKSLEWLFQFNSEDEILDLDIAYLFAYCLQRADFGDESMDIIERLGGQCYPPALVTIGDAHLAFKQVRQAVDSYSHAIDHGHFRVLGRRNKIIARNLPIFRSCLFRVYWMFLALEAMFSFIKNGNKMEVIGYLDFYGVKKNLDDFWAFPRDKRIELLKKQPIDAEA